MLGSKENLQSLQVYNARLCRAIKGLKDIYISRCYVIGATRTDNKLQVKISKTHLGQKSFSKVDPVVQDSPVLSREQIMGICPISEREIPGILPLSAGKSLWIVKGKLSRSMLEENPELRDLVGFNPVLPDTRIALYCLVEPEHCYSFFNRVQAQSKCLGYNLVPSFFDIVNLVYVRVRGIRRDSRFSELTVLKDVVGLPADFFVRDDGHRTDEPKWIMVRSVSSDGDLPLGAEGEVSGSKEETDEVQRAVIPTSLQNLSIRQQTDVVIIGLQNLSICLEKAITKDDSQGLNR
ncbi:MULTISPECIES: DUF3023 domain-containing protein [Ehrlichia]|uniref:Uncharacterized protein n=1 Tax=Ehrlichia cf. muris str. EmCRT TaxID=1359167 RepID=A0A0F3NGE5_9RICK|nr:MULTISPECIES: DUF3023 domain-containing protein [Ehrlichia]KJV65974.1 hypothetical protein EMUCRT_0159 [Ehrlichia cf. muris str. EmCRT]OUC04876.1 hypothetical protein DB91_01235 [Ehrlichia sp. Wisconsin_h]